MQTSLPNRSVIRLSGPDTDSLLQGIITQDIGLLQNQPVIFSAMLSAQGKFQHDFFILADGGDRLIDIDASHKDAFMKKLKMYKLRSQVTIEDISDAHSVEATWGETPDSDDWHTDPRHEKLGWRRIIDKQEGGNINAYDAHRLSLAIPDGVVDATDRYFALELGYDQLNGVSFTKGCFVGQEPTARMHYRKVLRKCLYKVQSDGPLPEAGTEITADGKTLGELRSSHQQTGLAMCRIEPVETAEQQGTICFAGSSPVILALPNHMRSKLAEIKAHETQAQSE